MADLMLLAAAAAEHGGEHAGPSAFGLAPVAWVSLAMIVLLAVAVWKKVPAMLTGMLDKSIAEIRHQLDEAKKLVNTKLQ